MNQLAPINASRALPALIAAAGKRASVRFLEFFAANIRTPHTRRAYRRAVADFLTWCDNRGVAPIAAVQPLHVAAWVELQQQGHAAPTVKSNVAGQKLSKVLTGLAFLPICRRFCVHVIRLILLDVASS